MEERSLAWRCSLCFYARVLYEEVQDVESRVHGSRVPTGQLLLIDGVKCGKARYTRQGHEHRGLVGFSSKMKASIAIFINIVGTNGVLTG